MSPVRIGVLDSGIGGKAAGRVVGRFAACSIRREHGSAVAATLLEHCPDAELLDAQIFEHTLTCPVSTLVNGLAWLATQSVDIVNVSLGLQRDDPALYQAVNALLDAGVLVVASAPARGAAVYPASYPSVISATGDARCSGIEVSWLHSAQADFGGAVRANDHAIAGASIGSANVCGALAAIITSGEDSDPVQALQQKARFIGTEHKR